MHSVLPCKGDLPASGLDLLSGKRDGSAKQQASVLPSKDELQIGRTLVQKVVKRVLSMQMGKHVRSRSRTYY